MNVARGLERRLERLLEGVLGRVFTGRLHPSEIATRIAREADLARFDHPSGPATANSFMITFNPRDLDDSGEELARTLRDGFAEYVVDAGLRLVGPPRFRLTTDEAVLPGQFRCHLEVEPGPQPEWARLVEDQTKHPIGPNRAIVGRSADADVTLPHDDVSRMHCLIWRASGSTWIQDLGSSNGTLVDGRPVGSEPMRMESGSGVSLGARKLRFVEGRYA